MNIDHLVEIRDKSRDFIELYKLISDFILAYRKIINDYISDDEINSNNDLKESISNVFKILDDFRTEIDVITHYIVRWISGKIERNVI